jgi:hypothetical protein
MPARHHDYAFTPEAFLNGCRGKVRHTSKRLALGRLRVMLKTPTTTDADRLQVYHCAGCHGWHIGRGSRR